MKTKFIFECILCLLISSTSLIGQTESVSIQNDNTGMTLLVNDKPFMINGMNWDYYPRGTNYTYNLWTQPDDIIRAALDTEMAMLSNIGVNAIRQYTGIPQKWITYIFEKHGIYTMLNHSFGRYGLTLNGKWVANTAYDNTQTVELLLNEVTVMAEEYQNTPGLLMYLLGNENNYGLFWEGAETEDIPSNDTITLIRARAMYQLFNEAVLAMKEVDTMHPIAICNGDLLFLDVIVEECKDVDIFGVNMYRGASMGDAFTRVKNEYGKPLMFTEFGADAFNAITKKEDQVSQAFYVVENWKEIYQNAAGKGQAQNSIGGFIFQFSDGWWKFGQTKNLDVHDDNASWVNGGYKEDYRPGENNMNEEWFGICAKGPNDKKGLYKLTPRAAYYALREVHNLNVYDDQTTTAEIDKYFIGISIEEAAKKCK